MTVEEISNRYSGPYRRSISASESAVNSHIAFQINSYDTALLSCKETAHHIMKTCPCNI